MEPELPSTVLSNILLRSGLSSFENLANTNKSMQSSLTSVQQDQYQYKLMLEDLLGMEIPMPYDDWKGSYEFVLATQPNVEMLFTRDVFHAQLGIELAARAKYCVLAAVKSAEIETIRYLMTESKWASDEVWNTSRLVDSAQLVLREEVVMLLFQDGRCFTDEEDIETLIADSACHGMSRAYFYLIENYPNRIPDDIGQAFLEACSSGARDIAVHIASIPNVDLDDDELDDGFALLDWYDDPTNEKLYEATSVCMLGCAIMTGHFPSAAGVLKDRSKSYTRVLEKAIRTGGVHSISQIGQYLRTSSRTFALLNAAINTLTVEYVTDANQLALDLFDLVNEQVCTKFGIRLAVSKGKVALAKEMQRRLSARM